MKQMLDKRVAQNSMAAKGDNCAGIIGQLIENQENLKGKQVEYRESMPRVRISAIFNRMEIDDGILNIIVDNAGKEEVISSINTDYLGMNIDQSGITFSVEGLGSFAGETTISL